MTDYVTPTTWEQCAAHVEAGGIVEVFDGFDEWLDEGVGPSGFRSRPRGPGIGTWEAPRRLVPIETEAYRKERRAIDVPDGYEAVWLPSETVDEFGAGEDDRVSRGHVVAGAREAQARRGTTPAPSPAPSPVPPWPDGVLRDAANRLRWIADSGYIEDPGIKRIIRSWADELDATPVPPWPGAVLSGLTDEDGVPTWLAQAGQVRGEQVRIWHGEPWGKPHGSWANNRWVEVRAPRAVPAPETERVPWYRAMGRTLPYGELLGDIVQAYPSADSPGGIYVEYELPERNTTGNPHRVDPDGTVEVLRQDGDR